MKLRFFIKDNKKVYTMKENIDNSETKSAHYKFVKIKDAPKSNSKKSFFRKS